MTSKAKSLHTEGRRLRARRRELLSKLNEMQKRIDEIESALKFAENLRGWRKLLRFKVLRSAIVAQRSAKKALASKIGSLERF